MLASESREPSCYQALQPPQKAALSGDLAPLTPGPTGLPAPRRQAHAGTRAHARARTSARPADCDTARTARSIVGGHWRSSRDKSGMGNSKPYLFKRRLPHVLMDRQSEKRIPNEPIYRSEGQSIAHAQALC